MARGTFLALRIRRTEDWTSDRYTWRSQEPVDWKPGTNAAAQFLDRMRHLSGPYWRRWHAYTHDELVSGIERERGWGPESVDEVLDLLSGDRKYEVELSADGGSWEPLDLEPKTSLEKSRRRAGRPPRTEDPFIQDRWRRAQALRGEHPDWNDDRVAKEMNEDPRTIKADRRAFEPLGNKQTSNHSLSI